MRTRRLLPVLGILALAACATTPSPPKIDDQLRGLPGVVSVSAGTVGDDDIPFGHGAVYVSIEMAADATADQVATVLGELDGELDEDEVESIEVRMAGPKLATLTTCGDLHDSERLAGDLVTAYGDAEVLSYEHGGWYVGVRLATEDFDHVVTAADHYGDAGDPDEVSVYAGHFHLDRARADPNPALTAARTRFVQRVDDEFELTGAVVSGRAPLELWTTWKRRDALRAFVAGDPEAQGLGPVVVRTASIPGS